MIIWRRHVAPCESTDHSDTKCGCPIYQEFRVGKKRFCHVSGWIATNPALALKPNKTVDKQIVPITKDEFTKLLKACDTYPDKTNRIRLRAIVLVLRYTGLRIRDVVTLRKDHIKHGKLFLRTAKTGTNVFCPLPPDAVNALNAVQTAGDYYFWSGTSKPRTAVGHYQRALRTLFSAPKTPRVHAPICSGIRSPLSC
jgi:integrase/recombinase XerD